MTPGCLGPAWLWTHHLAVGQGDDAAGGSGCCEAHGRRVGQDPGHLWSTRPPGAYSLGSSWTLRRGSWDKIMNFIFLNGHYFILSYK